MELEAPPVRQYGTLEEGEAPAQDLSVRRRRKFAVAFVLAASTALALVGYTGWRGEAGAASGSVVDTSNAPTLDYSKSKVAYYGNDKAYAASMGRAVAGPNGGGAHALALHDTGAVTVAETCVEGARIKGDAKCSCKDTKDGKDGQYCIARAVVPHCASTTGFTVSMTACACPSSDAGKAKACDAKTMCKAGKDASTVGTCTAPPACKDGEKIGAAKEFPARCTCEAAADGTTGTCAETETDAKKANAHDKKACEKEAAKSGCEAVKKTTDKDAAACTWTPKYCIGKKILPLCAKTDDSHHHAEACACPSKDGSKAKACGKHEKCKVGADNATAGTCTAQPRCEGGADTHKGPVADWQSNKLYGCAAAASAHRIPDKSTCEKTDASYPYQYFKSRCEWKGDRCQSKAVPKITAEDGKCNCGTVADGKKGKYCLNMKLLDVCAKTDDSTYADKACACPSKDGSKAIECRVHEKCKIGADNATPGACTAVAACTDGAKITENNKCTCTAYGAGDASKDTYYYPEKTASAMYCVSKKLLPLCAKTDDSAYTKEACACPSKDGSKAKECKVTEKCKIGADNATTGTCTAAPAACTDGAKIATAAACTCKEPADAVKDKYCLSKVLLAVCAKTDDSAATDKACACPSQDGSKSKACKKHEKCKIGADNATAGTCTAPAACTDGAKITEDNKCTCKDGEPGDGAKDKYCVSKVLLPACAKTDDSAATDKACACPSKDGSKSKACKKHEKCKIGADNATAGTCTAPAACTDGAKIAEDNKCTCKDGEAGDGAKNKYCVSKELLPVCEKTDDSTATSAACACPSKDGSKAAKCAATKKCKAGADNATAGTCS